MILGLSPAAWMAIGFAGQALFTARFLVQWVASEKRGESVVPNSFWWLSVSGSAVLAVFAAVREDPVFLLGSMVNGFLYARNLILIYFSGAKPTSRRVLIPTVLAIAAFLLYAGWGKLDRSIPAAWLVVGFVGAALWSGRFVIQWYASERAGKSVVPRAFWYVGLAGALLLLSYSVLRKEPVFILGYLFPPFPYIRNLILIYRKEGAPGLVRWGQRVWREPRSRAVAIAVFAVLLAAFLAVRAMASERPPAQLQRYRQAGTIVMDGNLAHLYRQGHEVHDDGGGFRPLPGVAVALIPLGLLPVRVAEVGWVWLNAFCFLMTLAVARWFTRRYGVRAAWMWVPFFLVLRFGWDSLNLGEIHAVTVLCVTGGIYLAETGRAARGGLLAGVAASINPALLLVGILLAVRRSWVAAGCLLLAVCLMAFVVPGVVAGPEGAGTAVSDYAESLGTRLFHGPGAVEVPGQSLYAMCHRLLGSVPYWKKGETLDVSWGLLDDSGSDWAFGVLAALLTLWVLVTGWRRRAPTDSPAVWSMALCVVVLLIPEARQPHFLMLLLPATTAVMVLAKTGLRTSSAKVTLGLLILAFALAAIPSRGIIGREATLRFSAYCAVGFAALALLAATALVMRVEK